MCRAVRVFGLFQHGHHHAQKWSQLRGVHRRFGFRFGVRQEWEWRPVPRTSQRYRGHRSSWECAPCYRSRSSSLGYADAGGPGAERCGVELWARSVRPCAWHSRGHPGPLWRRDLRLVGSFRAQLQGARTGSTRSVACCKAGSRADFGADLARPKARVGQRRSSDPSAQCTSQRDERVQCRAPVGCAHRADAAGPRPVCTRSACTL